MQVLSLNEAAARAGVVRRTLERLISTGQGPATVQLSTRRVGVIDDDLSQWILGRRKPAPGDIMRSAISPARGADTQKRTNRSSVASEAFAAKPAPPLDFAAQLRCAEAPARHPVVNLPDHKRDEVAAVHPVRTA